MRATGFSKKRSGSGMELKLNVFAGITSKKDKKMYTSCKTNCELALLSPNVLYVRQMCTCTCTCSLIHVRQTEFHLPACILYATGRCRTKLLRSQQDSRVSACELGVVDGILHRVRVINVLQCGSYSCTLKMGS